ncbi:MAG: hypothetical protein ABIC36_03550 [bacterium]
MTKDCKIILSDKPTLKAFATISTPPCLLDYNENAKNREEMTLFGLCACICVCPCPCICTCVCVCPRPQ